MWFSVNFGRNTSWLLCHFHQEIHIVNLSFFTVLGFPGGSGSKESTCNAGDLGSIPGLRSPGKGNGYPLQNSCLENLMDRGTWQAIVHGIAESQTRLNDFHILFFIVGVSIYIPTNCVGGLPSLHTLSSIYCLCGFFDDSHSGW